MNTKAVFFTLSSILLVGVLLLIFGANFTGAPVDTRLVVAQDLNMFRTKLEQSYIPSALREHSHRTLYVLADDAYNRPGTTYLSLPNDFTQASFSGTYSAGALPATYQTLPQAMSNLSAAAQSIGYNLSITAYNITITQVSTFQAAYSANISYTLVSRDGSTRFARNQTYTGTFYLTDIPDLYYNYHSRDNGYGEYLYITEENNSGWNNAAVQTMYTARQYATNVDGPSIFGRLTNSITPSTYGVETMIPPSESTASNGTVFDWEAFSGVTYECTYEQAAIGANFRIDLGRITPDYNVTGSTPVQGGCPAAPQ